MVLLLFLLRQKHFNLLLYTAELLFFGIRERRVILQRKRTRVPALDLVRENQQSSAHNFVKDFSPIFLKSSRRSPLKKGAATENPLEYGKTEVQILFEPLQAAISSMELPKNFENKKLPNTLR